MEFQTIDLDVVLSFRPTSFHHLFFNPSFLLPLLTVNFCFVIKFSGAMVWEFDEAHGEDKISALCGGVDSSKRPHFLFKPEKKQ